MVPMHTSVYPMSLRSIFILGVLSLVRRGLQVVFPFGFPRGWQQICDVTMNILDKQYQIAGKGWFFKFGGWEGSEKRDTVGD